jgi:site-specific recombinase XerD
LAQVTPRMIEDYLVGLRQTKTRIGTEHSGATVRRHYDMLNQIFNLAIRERIANDNPCRLVSRNVLKDFPTWEKRERWLNKYDAEEEGRLFASFNDYGEHLPAICRIILNTGIRPPKEVLGIKKEHVNLFDEARYYKTEKVDVLIPPRAVLVEKGKDGKPRVLPLNRAARGVFTVLVGDTTTGEWLFTNRGGGPMKSIKKGFAAASVRAKIEDLRPLRPAPHLRHKAFGPRRPPVRHLRASRPRDAGLRLRPRLADHARLRARHLGGDGRGGRKPRIPRDPVAECVRRGERAVTGEWGQEGELTHGG